MIQSNSRVEIDNGIKFYEQDILYDDYIYTGNTDIEVTLDYVNPGFGIALINSEGNYLSEKKEILLFKMNNKNVEIIYKNKDNLDSYYNPVKGNLNAAYAKCYSEDLTFKISKVNNNFFLNKEGKDVLDILNKIYENSTEKTRLNRKYQLYCTLVK